MGKHNKKGSVYAQNKKVASSSKQQVVLPKRLTFTALEKLRIIDEVERSNDAQAVLQKYGTQPRSFQRWKCDRSKLEKQVAKGSTSKRTIRTDPLRRIKEIVTNYISANKTTIRVTGKCIKTRAFLAKDHLLQQHAQQPFLSDIHEEDFGPFFENKPTYGLHQNKVNFDQTTALRMSNEAI